MPKITKRHVRKPYQAVSLSGEEIDLRRWCIEQAIRWPVESGSIGYASSGISKPAVEADVIGRATKLLNWVNGAKS